MQHRIKAELPTSHGHFWVSMSMVLKQVLMIFASSKLIIVKVWVPTYLYQSSSSCVLKSTLLAFPQTSADTTQMWTKLLHGLICHLMCLALLLWKLGPIFSELTWPCHHALWPIVWPQCSSFLGPLYSHSTSAPSQAKLSCSPGCSIGRQTGSQWDNQSPSIYDRREYSGALCNRLIER